MVVLISFFLHGVAANLFIKLQNNHMQTFIIHTTAVMHKHFQDGWNVVFMGDLISILPRYSIDQAARDSSQRAQKDHQGLPI